MQTAISFQYFDGQEHLEGFGQLKERRPSAGLIDCNAAQLHKLVHGVQLRLVVSLMWIITALQSCQGPLTS